MLPSARVALPLGILLCLFSSMPASAAEVQFEGFYRARGRAYDSLSLTRESYGEGLAAYAQHRFWLRPKFIMSEDVAVFADFRGLDGVAWGNQPNQWVDPVAGETPLAWTDDVTAPTSSTDERAPLLNFSLWRVWGEVRTPIGQFKVGRMPLHWGTGIWQNDGLGWNADYGDTADRVQWENEFDSVFVRVALDLSAEGYLNQSDDVVSYNGVVAYRAERIEAGLNLQFRQVPSADRDFTLFTADAAGRAEIGNFLLQGEVVGQFGGGDLSEGVNDVQVTAVGAVLKLGYLGQPLQIELEGGFASGDGNLNDKKLRTFTFDRDYNVGILMFEHTLPTLAAAQATELNGGRDLSAALTAPAISNALFVKPTVRRSLMKGLDVEASVIAARTAQLPDGNDYAGRQNYGIEVDAAVKYKPVPQVELIGTGAVFLPGSWYSEYSDETYTSGFSGTAVGGQLLTRIRF